tara:strand:+ start:1022 stop:1933 length:912 start_codon:yes stop_codon:yes gene_type:complete
MKNYILCYHGVAEDTDLNYNLNLNKNGKHISVDSFYTQMKFLSQTKNVVSINDLKLNRNLKEENVIITFDDGFKNNLKALEILDKFNLPAILYLTIGNLLEKKMFWVDIIEDFIYSDQNLTNSLELDDMIYMMDNHKNKYSSLLKIKFKLKRMAKSKRDLFISSLFSKYNYKPNTDYPLYRLLSINDIKKINKNSLFSIGGHTLYHDPMTTFDCIEDLIKDTSQTIMHLENITGENIDNYSYPEGISDFYSARTSQVLKNQGVSFCPTADFGINEKLIFPNYNAKRILVGFEKITFPFQFLKK